MPRLTPLFLSQGPLKWSWQSAGRMTRWCCAASKALTPWRISGRIWPACPSPWANTAWSCQVRERCQFRFRFRFTHKWLHIVSALKGATKMYFTWQMTPTSPPPPPLPLPCPSVDSTLYLAGGEFPDGSASREMWRYDPCFDSWMEMAPMNVARSELGKEHFMIIIFLAAL